MRKRYIVSQTITQQAEILASSEEEAQNVFRDGQADSYAVVDCSDIEVETAEDEEETRTNLDCLGRNANNLPDCSCGEIYRRVSN